MNCAPPPPGPMMFQWSLRGAGVKAAASRKKPANLRMGRLTLSVTFDNLLFISIRQATAMIRRREVLKTALLAATADVPAQTSPDRLNQGPFDIDQDDGW